MIFNIFRKKTDRRQKIRMPIGAKLISIISLTIIMSLSTMIVLASYFFKGDNEKRIIENNLDFARVISLKVKSDFVSILKIATLMVESLDHTRTVAQAEKKFYANEKDIFFIGIASRIGNSLHIKRSLYNNLFLQKHKIPRYNIKKSINQKKKDFIKSFNTIQMVENVSLSLDVPAIGISVPYIRTSESQAKEIMIIYLSMNKFLEAVRSAGIIKTFIVNSDGYLLAHHNSTLVKANIRLDNLGIVKMFMQGKTDNGQKRFKDDKGIWNIGSYQKIGFANACVVSMVKEDVAFAAVKQIQKRNILITVIVLNLAILIVYFFAKTITKPISRLVDATKEIENGNFDFQLPNKAMPADELGMLMRSFNEMNIGLSEREKMKDAFGKFVNKTIAELVLKGEVKLGGERKIAAVFFSDIRQFTAISEKLEPEEVVEFLNNYMTRMVDCVNKTNGVVDKFIGDAVMAIWGAPVTTGNDTENAINGALLMRKSLKEFNEIRKKKNKIEIKIGCGINTGPVLAGQIGSQDKMEYTVIGDTVNIASRIESLNKPFGTDILISENSYELVKTIFAVEKMQPIKVKGKTHPLNIYAVLGRLDDATRPKSLIELQDRLEIDRSKLPIFDPDEKETKFEFLSENKSEKNSSTLKITNSPIDSIDMIRKKMSQNEREEILKLTRKNSDE